jgi:uncharacterized protein
MKIAVTQLTLEPRRFREDIPVKDLDVETDVIKFREPIRVDVRAQRITNAVSIDLSLGGAMDATCGRCLEEFTIELDRYIQLHYQVKPTDQALDLDGDIREEIILGYPMHPLCKAGCKGLCATCGKNLNEGGCSCATTQKKTF